MPLTRSRSHCSSWRSSATRFSSRSEPDPEPIQRFNTLSGTQLFPVATILLTVVAAGWVVRRVDPATATVHGLAVAVLAGLLELAFGAFDATMAVRFAATVVAGILGAKPSVSPFDG